MFLSFFSKKESVINQCLKRKRVIYLKKKKIVKHYDVAVSHVNQRPKNIPETKTSLLIMIN